MTKTTYNGKGNLVHFKKGDPKINRNGAPRKNPSVRMVVDALQAEGVKKVTRSDAESLVFTLLNLTMDELAEIAQGKLKTLIQKGDGDIPDLYEERIVPYLAQAVAMDILGAKSNSRTMANLIDDMRQTAMTITPATDAEVTPLIVRLKG